MNRRRWISQSALALAGMGWGNTLLASHSPFPEKYRTWERRPGDPIYLGSNENAYGPSPMARQAMAEAGPHSNRYPDAYVDMLKKKIAAHWGVDKDNILLGAGSSEIIGLACLLAARKKGHVITAEPSYSIWNGQATAYGLSFRRNPYPKNGDISPEKLYGPISAETRMVYICNPNNPTGTTLDMKKLEQYVSDVAKRTLVFIDEAYTEYAGLPSLAPLAVKNPNIVVAKTFSKIYGLAGARAGYAITHPQTIRVLGSFQPWPDANVSTVTAAAAMASLDDQDFVNDCREKTSQAREICYAAFKQLGLEYIPSHTNFILFNLGPLAGKFREGMRSRNIEVQFREHYGGKWCRVSMGTLGEIKRFCDALKDLAV